MESVFEKFGGIRPMAAKLGDLPASTVKSWHSKGVIPPWRHASILSAARQHGIEVTATDLINIPPKSKRAA